jgi:DNA-binding NtrC family response regulator
MSQKQHSILVVEDETSIASFVSAYLRNAGYAVKTAENRRRSSSSTSTSPTVTGSSSRGESAGAPTSRSSC